LTHYLYGMEKRQMGQKLARLRRAKGFSQFDLAVATGIPTGTIQGWEQGRRLPRLDALQKVAKALEVDLGTLVSGRSGPAKPKRRGRPRKGE
jgi:transcriptional regulator with XRE-family HTH domain